MNALLSPATAVATAAANSTSTSTVTPGALRSRTGKIARLPQAIRQRLNERLADGEPQHLLVAWLNEQEVMRDRLLLARTKGAGGAGAGRREESAGTSRSQREDSADGNPDSEDQRRALAGGGSRGYRSRVVVVDRAQSWWIVPSRGESCPVVVNRAQSWSIVPNRGRSCSRCSWSWIPFSRASYFSAWAGRFP